MKIKDMSIEQINKKIKTNQLNIMFITICAFFVLIFEMVFVLINLTKDNFISFVLGVSIVSVFMTSIIDNKLRIYILEQELEIRKTKL